MLARSAAEDQALATQTSSITFLQRTIKHLKGENDKIRQELSALKQSYETHILQNQSKDHSDSTQQDRVILMLRAEIEKLKEHQRLSEGGWDESWGGEGFDIL